jgi:hypothetical protein
VKTDRLQAIVGTTLVAASCSAASAQLVPLSDTAQYFRISSLGSYSELPGGEFQTSSQFVGGSLVAHMTGDLRLEVDPDELPQNTRRVGFDGVRQFQIAGDIPVQVTPEITANYKFVNAGGDANGGWWSFVVPSIIIHETGEYVNGDPFRVGLGAQVFPYAAQSPVLDDNGFEVIDDTFVGDGFVLLPGISYTAFWGVNTVAILDGITGNDPAAATFLEAGGVTDFDGFEFRLNAIAVPTPGTAAIAGLGFVAASRRRRARGPLTSTQRA